ncbi:SusC/RagA family TonB-linked outer membrane protein [Bacteroides sp. 51]|uniref:SusC/RagA family TonB-linked outer membrane protein n=1 Tax=Bacteroides sp. 51 TaxID=2302938 RepID=UPI0013D17FCE|nr:SusC/RagA family TonB-linked outer membrane protein [Bacteroides sp. 51]NDV83479.1 SusC/RagA family TonB-linked outer membrane protein [Bacteroides sp. 51]
MKEHLKKTQKHGCKRIPIVCFIFLFMSTGIIRAVDNELLAQTVTASFRNISLNEVIWELQKQTDFTFVYSTNDIKGIKVKDVRANNQEVTEVLNNCLENTGLTYTVHNGVVAIKRAEAPIVASVAPQQRVNITGTIVDTHGESMPGVNVLVKGTQTGTISDVDGNFTITIDGKTATLTVSFIGYDTQDVQVTAGKTVQIVMREDAVMVDEVVVVAYGQQKRSAFTGSASVISSDAIARRPVTNVMNAIEGSAPGVQVQSTSGAPDASPSFRIRGASSISAGRDPLIVVDGVPYESGLNNINPNDVESVTVLKDAASTAIYGARGGNGVVLITTKKATKQERISVTLDTKMAISKVRKSDLYDVISSPGEYYELQYDALYNYMQNVEGKNSYEANQAINDAWAKSPDYYGLGYLVYTIPNGEGLIGYNGKLNPNATLGRLVTGRDGQQYYQTPDDWADATYQTGIRQDYNLSIKGGTDKLNMLASMGYTKDEGITEASGYERFTGRLKGTFHANKWLRFSANLDMAKSATNSNTDYSNNSNNIFSNVNMVAPIYPLYIRDANGDILYDKNGKMYDYGNGDYNNGVDRPVRTGSNRIQEALIQTRKTESVKVGIQGAADFIITPELTATLNVAYDERDRRYKSTSQPFYGTSNPTGAVSVTAYKNESLNTQQILNYSKSFGSHNVKATILHEAYQYDYYYLYGNKSNMFNYYENQELAGAIIMNDVNSYTRRYESEGYGGRVLYDYNGIYSFDASYRRDASSHFHPDNRWGDFYSFGAAYLISKEDFFKVTWIDMLKVKFSYGQNGNDQIGYHRYIDTYNIENVMDEVGAPIRNIGNKNITWETRTAINTGIEFEMFKGRLRGDIEYYNNKTTDMLASVAVPYSLGYSSVYDNVGSVRNSGFEFEFSGDIIRKRDFRWTMYANASFNKAKVLKLSDTRTGETIYNVDGSAAAKGYSSGKYFYGEGLEYKTWYLKKFAGINENGLPMWYTRDSSTEEITTTTTYSSATELACGSSQPKMLGGFGGSFAWKSLELSFKFAYRLGGYAYDSGYASLMTRPTNRYAGYNFHKDVKDSWTPENPSTDNARWQYADLYFVSTSDRWLTKADYLNLQNISLSYIVPKKIVRRFGIEGLTASVGADDLFFWSKRKGFVPSRDFDGNLDVGYYPNTRRYLLNLKFDF